MEINIESWKKKVVTGALPDEEKKTFSVELDRLSVWRDYANERAWAIKVGGALCIVAVLLAVSSLFFFGQELNGFLLSLSSGAYILGMLFYLRGHGSLDEYRKRTIDFLIKYAEALETRRDP